jgi:hypothetical protein
VENGIVHIRKLTVVRDRGTSIEVGDGVKNGDQVILNPPADLVEGQTVNSHAVAAPDAYPDATEPCIDLIVVVSGGRV